MNINKAYWILFVLWIIATMAITLSVVGIIYLYYYHKFWFSLPDSIFDKIDRKEVENG
jgi:hypothetical protein